MSEAVKKIQEHIENAKGTRFSPEDLPFKLVHDDFNYGRSKYGNFAQFVFEVPMIEHTQTPRMAYVEVIADVSRTEGIEDPSAWNVSEVEKKTKTITKWEKK